MRPSGIRSTRTMRAVQPTCSGSAGSPTSRPLRISTHAEQLVGDLAGADHDLVTLFENAQWQRHAREQDDLFQWEERQNALCLC